MSGFDRVFRAIGIALLGSALSWLASFGVVFCIETGQGKIASITGVGDGGWMAVPAILSFASLVAGVLTSTERI
jgi:hypothetical protein